MREARLKAIHTKNENYSNNPKCIVLEIALTQVHHNNNDNNSGKSFFGITLINDRNTQHSQSKSISVVLIILVSNYFTSFMEAN